MRVGLAFRAFFKILSDAAFGNRVAALAASGAKVEAKDDLRVLGLLQRDGRLVDFLLEDISDYSDEQVGAAVRDIHRDTRQCLLKYFEFEPVLNDAEGAKTTVAAGFDPQAIRLTGAVKGSPPHRGTVAHRGWRVKASKLPPLAANGDAWLIAPAEVEVT